MVSSKTKANHREKTSTLALAVARLIRCTGFENNLLVSPGYLSTSEGTIKNFFARFDQLLTTDNSGSIDIGFLRGMGSIAVFEGLVRLHEKELRGAAGHVMSFRPVINLETTSKDHRKMLFFYSHDGIGYYPNTEAEVNQRLTKQDALDFAHSITVNAIAIGSSNFSNNTYFGPFEKGESDVILLAHDSMKRSSDFTEIISAFRAASSGNDNSGSNERSTSIAEEFPESVFSESIFCSKEPHDYLKDILIITIEQKM